MIGAENTTVRVEYMISRIKGVVTRKVNEVLKDLGYVSGRGCEALFSPVNETFFSLPGRCYHDPQTVGLESCVGNGDSRTGEAWLRKQVEAGNFTIANQKAIRETVQALFELEGTTYTTHYGVPLVDMVLQTRTRTKPHENKGVTLKGVIKVPQKGRAAWERQQDKAIKAADKRIRAIVAAGRGLAEDCILSGDKDEFKQALSEFAKQSF